jgi:uncharacterized protein
MLPPVAIRPQDLAIVQAILRDHGPAQALVWVFGSRAHGTVRRSSDLDLAIDAGRPLTCDENLALADAFEESDLPYGVDVVDMHRISPTFRLVVEAGRVPLPDMRIDGGDRLRDRLA